MKGAEIDKLAWLHVVDLARLTPAGQLPIDELVARGVID
jgi:hypothetical protein